MKPGPTYKQLAVILLSASVVALLAVYAYSRARHPFITLQTQGKATICPSGIGLWSNETYPLEFWRGKWRWIGKELALPFECEYNETRNLRVETDGKVYMVDKSRPYREQLRVVDGEWSYNADDHWQSIFDLDVP